MYYLLAEPRSALASLTLGSVLYMADLAELREIIKQNKGYSNCFALIHKQSKRNSTEHRSSFY